VTESSQTRQALAIFKRALSFVPEEREAFLDAECAMDAELRSVVEGMLQLDEASPDPSAADGAVLFAGLRQLDEPRASFPERVGKYSIVRCIGTGGMGTVYEAEQESPRRKVALKVLSSGLFDAERRRRFEREVDVLGRTRHPNIAQVFEGGALELEHAVQPYIAMELVDGYEHLELLEHIEREQPSTTERLELVACIADAAQHAHERGVVHRDLKPANVLVDARGQVKLVDFGVAQVLKPTGRPATLTRAGDIVGTLSYMSPEQAAGRPEEVDTRSDVYAIGVILYRVVTGRLPYEVDELPLDEAVRVVRNTPPRRRCRRDTTATWGPSSARRSRRTRRRATPARPSSRPTSGGWCATSPSRRGAPARSTR
jgi:serine/threonine protein kinase